MVVLSFIVTSKDFFVIFHFFLKIYIFDHVQKELPQSNGRFLFFFLFSFFFFFFLLKLQLSCILNVSMLVVT